jgi:mRNA-degrading endonuclease RelE of RelBE toxin-antitoxin system
MVKKRYRRKAVDLSDEVIKKLQVLADQDGRKLKQFMEKVLTGLVKPTDETVPETQY